MLTSLLRFHPVLHVLLQPLDAGLQVASHLLKAGLILIPAALGDLGL